MAQKVTFTNEQVTMLNIDVEGDGKQIVSRPATEQDKANYGPQFAEFQNQGQGGGTTGQSTPGVAGQPGLAAQNSGVSGTTTRAVAATRGPLAVAMSANGAGSFGLYQIRGYTIAATAAAVVNAALYLSATAGQAAGTVVATQRIDNAIPKTAQDAPGVGFTGVYITYPSANGT